MLDVLLLLFISGCWSVMFSEMWLIISDDLPSSVGSSFMMLMSQPSTRLSRNPIQACSRCLSLLLWRMLNMPAVMEMLL